MKLNLRAWALGAGVILFVGAGFAAAQPSTAAAAAGTASPAAPKELTPAERAAKADQLARELAALFTSKEYNRAEAKCRELIALAPDAWGPYFNLAQALAMQEKKADALAALNDSVSRGFNLPDRLRQGSEFASLRDEKGFDEVLARCEQNAKAAAERQAKADQLNRETAALFAQKKYDEAEAKCRELIALAPKMPEPYYNLACALAQQGKKADALAALNDSVSRGYGDPDHLRQDTDLASLYEEKGFAEALAQCERNAEAAYAATSAQEKQFPYEKGADMEGVRTVENWPAGGLRYRIRMGPDATAEKPERLIVWLHPSGESANRVVEALAPEFIKHGFALLVMTQKQFNSWYPAEFAMLINRTLPDAARTEGISLKKPILFGYSAGGQAALMIWSQKPAAYGGLILDAAYPVVQVQQGGRTGFILMELPKTVTAGNQADLPPIFALIGEQDGGLAAWRQSAPKWEAAGIAITLYTVPDKGHAWLFGAKQVEWLMTWLDAVAKGGKPSNTETPAAPTPPAEGRSAGITQ